MPVAGSVAGASDEGGFPAAQLHVERRQGYLAAATACHSGARLGVPRLLNEEYVGCVIMRCLPETIAASHDCRGRAESLKGLAAAIIDDSAAVPGSLG